MKKNEIIEYLYDNNTHADISIEDMAEDLAEPELKKGKWIHRGCGVFSCDQCGKNVSTNVYTNEKASERFKYCPDCGSDMRGSAE